MTLYDPTPGQTLGFDMDDGTGLRVARARFQSESKFSWSLFDGYDRIRILTYSAGVSAIVRLLDKHGFSDFECVFGCEILSSSEGHHGVPAGRHRGHQGRHQEFAG